MTDETEAPEQRADGPQFELLTSHGRVLLFVAAHPGCTLQEIAGSLNLSARTVARVIADLREAGRLRVEAEGRRHTYVALARTLRALRPDAGSEE